MFWSKVTFSWGWTVAPYTILLGFFALLLFARGLQKNAWDMTSTTSKADLATNSAPVADEDDNRGTPEWRIAIERVLEVL